MIHPPIDIQFVLAATIGALVILIAAILWFMPRLTRPDLYFAVTVPPEFRDGAEGKSILQRYRTELVLASVLALALFVGGVVWFGIGFVSVGHLIELLAGFIVFYRARRLTLQYAVQPTTIREAELHQHDRVIPGGWMVASGPFILLAGYAAYLLIHGGETPVRLTNGQPVEFTGHALPVYLLSVSGVLVSLTLMLYGLSRWVRPVHASGPERQRELKFRRTISAILLAWEYIVTLQASWIMLARRDHGLIPVVTFPLTLVFVIAVFVVLARLGQGGSRFQAADPKSATTATVPVGDRTPDAYWKLGIFYFNPDDSAIFVEKRFGLGYSLNFARPTAWIIVGLLFMAPLIPIVAHLTHFLPKLGV